MRIHAPMLALLLSVAPAADLLAQESGRKVFETRCAACHGADGNGGEIGPPIVLRLTPLDDRQLTKTIREGIPAKGMPPQDPGDTEMSALIKFLRGIQRHAPPIVRVTLQTTDGQALDGQLLGEGFDDAQVRTDDKRVHLLRRSGERFRRVTSDVGWPTYNGDPGGNRYTTLTQIDKTTVSRLAPKWMFSIPDAGQLQVTPVVVDGIMYVTARNECFALDAGSGRRIWHYKRTRTQGVSGGHANRGVAVAGDRVFMMTDHAHLIALNRFTGELLWDSALEDWRKNYGASSAPLPAGNLVISGVSGGEHGANGFVTAHDQETGKEVGRFWTVPRPGEPGSETWGGKDIEHGGAPTWFTGSYDPVLDLLYWPTRSEERRVGKGSRSRRWPHI